MDNQIEEFLNQSKKYLSIKKKLDFFNYNLNYIYLIPFIILISSTIFIIVFFFTTIKEKITINVSSLELMNDYISYFLTRYLIKYLNKLYINSKRNEFIKLSDITYLFPVNLYEYQYEIALSFFSTIIYLIYLPYSFIFIFTGYFIIMGFIHLVFYNLEYKYKIETLIQAFKKGVID